MAAGISPFTLASIAVLITTYYSITWERQKLHEYPATSVVLVLFITGFGLLIIHAFGHRFWVRVSQYLPDVAVDNDLSDIIHDGDDAAPSYGKYITGPSAGARPRRHYHNILIVCISVRSGIFIHLEKDSQCTYPGVEVLLLLLLLFIHDLKTFQRFWNLESDVNEMSNSVLDDIYTYFSSTTHRYLAPLLLFALGIFMTTCFPYRSTYICPLTNRGLTTICYQLIAACIDAAIVVNIYWLQVNGSTEHRSTSECGSLAISSALVVGLASLVFLATGHEFSPTVVLDSSYVWSVIGTGIMSTILASNLERLIHHIRPLQLMTLFIFSGVFVPLVLSSRGNRAIFPPHSNLAKAVGLLLLFVGFTFMMSFYKYTEAKNNFATRVPVWFTATISVALVISETLYLTAPSYVGFSPINYLMYEANIEADQWRSQATTSKSLETAVKDYQTRYLRLPPPNFDGWYQYAQTRQSFIIDDYDQIWKDLLPFWAIPAAEVRQLTTIQDPNHGIAGITIRSGQVFTGHEESPETAWITETASMIRNFSHMLPDMNLGLNIYDEPQVAIPFNQIRKLREQGWNAHLQNVNGTSQFSLNLDPPWSDFNLQTQATRKPTFSPIKSKYTHVGIFDDIIAPLCPSNSAARKGRAWNQGTFCTSCAAPHTVGPFMGNWSTSADLCHQPDMASLHSYLSSSAREVTRRSPRTKLTPIFSRRTIPGFNDILFPGPDDYLSSPGTGDNLDFHDKANGLFWRGSLDEIPSTAGMWKGGQVQRFVHQINNATAPISLLLPDPTRLTYKTIPAAQLRTLVQTNVSFTHHKSDTPPSPDLTAQLKEFGTQQAVPKADWFTHRYLFSTDTPASTTAPTFLQMLASRSLPLHASIFRHWYSPRLTPWLHFIPLDLRYQGLWATLVYFTGLGHQDSGIADGAAADVVAAEGYGVDRKTDQAHFMAEAGREWVGRVIRREDAEVYLFRLLLEWARVVDDRRDELGFSVSDP